MRLICERCSNTFPANNGEYLYYQGRMIFACKECTKRLREEIKVSQKVCAAIDGKKTRAEIITNNMDAYGKFMEDINATLKKVPNESGLRSDIPLLVSLVKAYIEDEYVDISYNSIVAIVSTLLYVISPVDIIPDVIPGVGYSDDEVAVAFCVKMIHDDIEKFKSCCDVETKHRN